MTHDAYRHWNSGLTAHRSRKKKGKKNRQKFLIQKIHFVIERWKNFKKPKTLAKLLLVSRSNYSDNYITLLSLIPVLVSPLLIHIHCAILLFPTRILFWTDHLVFLKQKLIYAKTSFWEDLVSFPSVFKTGLSTSYLNRLGNLQVLISHGSSAYLWNKLF